MVKIDDAGKLRWARNNELVDTSAGHWKDAGGGKGIVPLEDVGDDNESSPPPRRSFDSVISADSSLSSGQESAATHYVGEPKGNSRLTRLLRRHFTLHGIVDRLLRKTVQRNTWIYVSDKNRLYFSWSDDHNLMSAMPQKIYLLASKVKSFCCPIPAT